MCDRIIKNKKTFKRILSHYPPKELLEHIDEVQRGVDFLLEFHSAVTIDIINKELLNDIVELHDVGKASSAFQEYIRAPDDYQGQSENKGHSRLSGFITGLLLIEKKVSVRHAYWQNREILF